MSGLRGLRVVSVWTGPGPSVEGYAKADVDAVLGNGELLDALDAADYELGRLLGNTDADNDALRKVRAARAALTEKAPDAR